jgi:predicted unusual protein kinase regulating ubiquinone biosynthesis (AarF/ABC1/UbiB family)
MSAPRPRRRGGVVAAVTAAAVGVGVLGVLTAAIAARRAGSHAVRTRGLGARAGVVMGIGARAAGRYASVSARKVFADSTRRADLDREHQLRTAQDVAARLGQMKGALMKLGQMASYLDEGLPEPIRAALAELRTNAPPMSAELAAEVIEAELGAPPGKIFLTWDPEPLAAASIGQVHRALVRDPATGRERAVAVKVQYPGVQEAVRSDLATTELLGMVLRQGFKGLDPAPMVQEIQARLLEELDYRREAADQQRFADAYRGHPTIHVPDVIPSLSTSRVLTTELVAAADWDELLTWDQAEKDRAAETIFRFVFRSLYGLHAFNGDPHPGNYLFHGQGKVTFLDFGLVKHFSADEIAIFQRMISAAVLDPDWDEFRRTVEEAGLLRPGAPVSTDDVGRYFEHFYTAVRDDRRVTWTPAYASATVRRTFDRDSPIAQYSTVPSSFVFIQRINLGLYAILGQLGATANWRRISEEIWPMVEGPPSTPLGEAEARWLAAHGRAHHVPRLRHLRRHRPVAGR